MNMKRENDMTSAVVAKQEGQEVARPLRILVPLIKEDLKHGDEAAQNAGMPFYTMAGAKIIEARDGNDLTGSALYDWAERNFHRSKNQIKTYIELAESKGYGKLPSATTTKIFKSLRDFERRHLGKHRSASGGGRRDWTAPVDDIAEKAKREAARIQDENLSREKERKAEYQLAMRLIDIGYKVLAKELHPDKGGSKDAMARLGRVRDRLKSHA